MPQAQLTLIRGLPGSGKSTLAAALMSCGAVDRWYEADTFFMRNGVYQFDRALLSRAHIQCLAYTKAALNAGHRVAVSNTFTQHWEAEPYLALCPNAQIIVCCGTYQNVHGVPPNAIEGMRQRWEWF